MKLIERIPLEPYAYIEIEASTLEELALLSKTTRQAYQERISKENVAIHADHDDVPPPLAQRAAQSFGPESKEKAYACPQCGTGTVTHKQGVSKKTGKPYAFWGCSNWQQGCKYTSKVSPNLPF